MRIPEFMLQDQMQIHHGRILSELLARLTKPAAFEFFDKSKQHIFSFNAEIEIYGNYSRAEVQKVLKSN